MMGLIGRKFSTICKKDYYIWKGNFTTSELTDENRNYLIYPKGKLHHCEIDKNDIVWIRSDIMNLYNPINPDEFKQHFYTLKEMRKMKLKKLKNKKNINLKDYIQQK